MVAWTAILLLANIGFVIFLLITSQEKLRKPFVRIKRETWFVLLILFLIGFGLRITAPWVMLIPNSSSFELEGAKNLVQRGEFVECNYVGFEKEFCVPHQRMHGSTFLLSLAFLGGLDVTSPILLNILAGSMGTFLVFILSYLFWGNTRTSIFATALYSIFPSLIAWSATPKSYTLGLFFVLSSLIFFLLYTKEKEISILWLGLFTLALAIQMRGEEILAVFFVALIFVISKTGYPKLDDKRLYFVPLLVLFSISVCFQLSGLYNINKEIGSPGIDTSADRTLHIISGMSRGEYYPFVLNLMMLIPFCLTPKDKRVIFCITWILMFTFFYAFTNQSLWDGKFTISFVGIILLAAHGCNMITDKIRFHKIGASIVFAMFLICVVSLLPVYRTNPTTMLMTYIPDIVEGTTLSRCYFVINSTEKLPLPTLLTATTALRVIPLNMVKADPGIFLELKEKGQCIVYYGLPVEQELKRITLSHDQRLDLCLEPLVRYTMRDKRAIFYSVKLCEI